MPYQFHPTLLGVPIKKLILLISMLPSTLYAADIIVLECSGTQLSDDAAVQFVFTLDTAKESVKDNHDINYGVYGWSEHAISFDLEDSTDEQGQPLTWDADRINTKIKISRESGDMVIVNGRDLTHKGTCETRKKLF
ncbi:MAG: hypothetical protein ACE5HM_00630 [Acidiferrobacterales bacterium]